MLSTADKEVIQYGIDQLDDMISNDETIEASELHNRLYNEDYFIIGTYQAKQFLDSVDGGAFEAIHVVQEYERDNFGEVTTDLSDPEKVANMYAYCVGYDALNDCEVLQEKWDEELTVKDLKKIVKELKEEL